MKKATTSRRKPTQSRIVGAATLFKYIRGRVRHWRRWKAVAVISALIFIAGALESGFGLFDRLNPSPESADKQDIRKILERLDAIGGKNATAGSYQITAELNAELEQFLGVDSTAYKLVADKLRNGDFTAATQLLERLAQADLSATPPQRSAGVDKLYLAGLLQSRLDYEEAVRVLEQALSIDPTRDDIRATLAVVRMSQGQTASASDLLEHAVGDPTASLMLANAAGLVALRDDDLIGAEAKFRWVLAQARANGSVANEAAALGNLGSVYSARGDLKTAEAYYNLSIMRNRGQQTNLDGNQYCNLGKSKAQSGDLAAAENYFRLAIDVFRYSSKKDCLPNALIGLGAMRLQRSDLRSAETLFRQALDVATQLGDPEGRVVALMDLALVAQMRRNPADKTFLRQALDIALAQAPDSHVFNMHTGIVRRYLLEGAPATRQQIRDIALKITESIRRVDGESQAYPRLAFDAALLMCTWGDSANYKIAMDVVLNPSNKWTNIYTGALLFKDTIHLERRYGVKCIFGTEGMDLSKI